MCDIYREITNTDWLTRLGDSFWGAILGIVLFFGSFGILYANEVRVDLSQIAKTSIEISATTRNPAAQSQLVSLTGAIASDQLLGDNLFLKPGKYIAVTREVEMFAWEENTHTKTKINKDGSETKTTEYRYRRKWVDRPENSDKFRHSAGHTNPVKLIQNDLFKVANAKIGIYNLEMYSVDVTTPNQVLLNDKTVILKDKKVQIQGDYLYQGKNTISNPEIGDLRLQYFTLDRGQNVTVLGKLNWGDRIIPYIDKSNTKLYRIFLGNRAESISTLKTEHNITTWTMRLVGFIIMWLGLALASDPISVFLDFIPFLGSISREFITGASLVVSLILSVVTILVSIFLHNIGVLAIVILAIIAAGLLVRKAIFD